ncbi:MAG: PAS domain S-box protein, partial [Stenotrophomonas sp.]
MHISSLHTDVYAAATGIARRSPLHRLAALVPFRTAHVAAQAAASRRQADLDAQIAALHRVQAVIEFDLQGTILAANPNFLQTVGYTLEEVRGRHHSMFVAPEQVRTPEYQA